MSDARKAGAATPGRDEHFAAGFRMGLLVASRKSLLDLEQGLVETHDEEADCWGEPHVNAIPGMGRAE